MAGIPVTHKGRFWMDPYDPHEDERRHRPVHACSIFLFRTLTAVARPRPSSFCSNPARPLITMVPKSRKAGAHSTPSSKVSAVVTHGNVGESKKLAETSAPFLHHLAQFGCQNHELLKSGSSERYWQLQLSFSPEFSSCKSQMHSVGSKRVFGAAGMVMVVVLISIAYCALIKKVLVADYFFFGCRWFLAANAVVFVYSVLGAIISFFAICVRRGPLSFSPTAWLTFLIDFLLASALISAASAALAVWWVGKNGIYTPRWTAICDEVNGFCKRIEAAIITSFIGWFFLALSAFVAVSSLHHLGRRRY